MKSPWTEQDAFRFTILMGLRKGFKVLHGMRRALDEREQKYLADAVADQIQLSGWEVRHKPQSKSGQTQ